MSKITEEVQREVLARVTAGATQEAVAEWLRTERGIEVTRQAVTKIVRKHRGALADANKSIARAHSARSLEKDLNDFDEHRAAVSDALRMATAAFASEDSVANADKMTKLGTLMLRMEDVADRRRGIDQPDEKITTLSALVARVAPA